MNFIVCIPINSTLICFWLRALCIELEVEDLRLPGLKLMLLLSLLELCSSFLLLPPFRPPFLPFFFFTSFLPFELRDLDELLGFYSFTNRLKTSVTAEGFSTLSRLETLFSLLYDYYYYYPCLLASAVSLLLGRRADWIFYRVFDFVAWYAASFMTFNSSFSSASNFPLLSGYSRSIVRSCYCGIPCATKFRLSTYRPS